ncbi:protease inhibitor I42 family protein [Methanimicrococcus blatticola]|uniref:Putative secreted protein n=1 Tax=Methanimicrococcus blatticola TaxID=91560 RepID=A0A484F373_9EURY|nr:protease inhibitor I42 family protein [Methanimicrococcus blatticola]MBZ3935960.1 protease inhibitor I42 family protein [Methanimicrococcus blatticola]MCC2509427.1 protease inhibitor I42 family protein [Methanimicrococcus blatticola]TDQ68309.1 putative secreted protein [Methanimicrococcus blatticola]
MKKIVQAFIFVCLILAVAATGCLTSDDGTNTTNKTINDTNNTSNLTDQFSTPANPINNTSYVPDNASAYLTKQVRVSDDKKSVVFVFDESSTGDKWELIMEPRTVLSIETDEHVTPENAPETYPGIHVWVFESIGPGKTIMNFNYIVEETGKSINNLIYIIEVNNAGEISIISVLHERL